MTDVYNQATITAVCMLYARLRSRQRSALSSAGCREVPPGVADYGLKRLRCNMHRGSGSRDGRQAHWLREAWGQVDSTAFPERSVLYLTLLVMMPTLREALPSSQLILSGNALVEMPVGLLGDPQIPSSGQHRPHIWLV